jgi:hypothetical protein
MPAAASPAQDKPRHFHPSLTAMKVRRHMVKQAYGAKLERLYGP